MRVPPYSTNIHLSLRVRETLRLHLGARMADYNGDKSPNPNNRHSIREGATYSDTVWSHSSPKDVEDGL